MMKRKEIGGNHVKRRARKGRVPAQPDNRPTPSSHPLSCSTIGS
jgi:hypothetical protein